MRREPDAERARRVYDAASTTYDRRAQRGLSQRRRMLEHAVELLDLRPGQTVIDVGCGTGTAFPHLVAAVTSTGHVIGIDQSAGMLDQARRRVEEERWRQVELIEAPAATARIPRPGDAALCFFTHDLLRDESALDNIVQALRPGALFVAAGMKRPPLWMLPLIVPMWLMMRRYTTTRSGFTKPWSLLDERAAELQVEPFLGGAAYVAAARLRS